MWTSEAHVRTLAIGPTVCVGFCWFDIVLPDRSRNFLSEKNLFWSCLAVCLSMPLLELPGNFPEISGKLPGTFQDISGKCPGNIPEISRKFHGHFREISGKCPGIVREMSGKCPENVREMSRKCPGHFREISWTCPGNFRKIFRKCPANNPGNLGKCPGNFREMSRKSPGHFQEMSRKFEIAGTIPGHFRGNPGKLPGNVQDMSGKSPGNFRYFFDNKNDVFSVRLFVWLSLCYPEFTQCGNVVFPATGRPPGFVLCSFYCVILTVLSVVHAKTSCHMLFLVATKRTGWLPCCWRPANRTDVSSNKPDHQ